MASASDTSSLLKPTRSRPNISPIRSPRPIRSAVAVRASSGAKTRFICPRSRAVVARRKCRSAMASGSVA
ncbi:hypothetical protein M2437_003595 [Methylorubrum pseudosasae]|nr:hypothetical protein [Methylorubrum pseudosasae]